MWKPKISSREFVCGYIKRSKITVNFYAENFVTMPCSCDADNCEGWAAIHKSPIIIFEHCKLYFPDISEYIKYLKES